MSFLIVFIFCFISSLFFCGLGVLSNKLIFRIYKIKGVLEFCFLGIFSLSFIGLFSNFFISLNIYFNSIIFIISIFYLIFLDKKFVKEVIKYSLIISLISILTIIFDYTNRPDSGLYHLPFTSLINEHRIIIGSANLNERFGIISILQYLSASNYNYLFSENGILIPLVIIYSSSLLFFLLSIFGKKKDDVIRVLSFLFFVFILTNINRYSGFGNDAPSHFYFFILVYYFLEFNNKQNASETLKLLIIISLYIFLIKPFFILLFFLPIIFIINNYRNIKFLNSNNFFCIFILSIWIVKNILITGCLIYPIEFTCFQNLDWTLDPNDLSLTAEAWTKGWPDRLDESLSYKEYLNNFIWINTWFNNHLIIILKKLIPFFTIIFFLSIVIIFKNKKKKKIIEKKYFQLIIYNFVLLLIWFLSFPNYRFGMGIICTFISLTFIIIFFNRFEFKNNFFYKFMIFFVCLSSSIIILKNVERIYHNHSINYVDYPWPRKNSHYLSNKKLINNPIKYNAETSYYIPPNGELCFYSKSPCTHKLNLKLKKETVFKFFIKYTVDNE